MKAVRSLRAGLFSLSITLSDGQSSVGIGTDTPDPHAILDMVAMDEDVLIPRMTTVQSDA